MRIFKALLLLIAANCVSAQEEWFKLDDGSRLNLEVAGDGQAMIFIPGWTMTHKFFDRQKEFFTEDYQVIAYDPRGQGRSDKTMSKNTYADHANDLRQIILGKNLSKVILVGWSNGCLTMYEYLKSYGVDRISKMVFIDEPPKWIGDVDTEWVYGSFDDYRSSLKGLITNPSDPDGIIDWMLNEPVEPDDRNWMKKEILMTPRDIAIRLYIDGLISDYTSEVRNYTSDVPSMFMVRSSWYEKANSWLDKNAPASKVQSISSHAMFWEKSQEFNELLLGFLMDE